MEHNEPYHIHFRANNLKLTASRKDLLTADGQNAVRRAGHLDDPLPLQVAERLLRLPAAVEGAAAQLAVRPPAAAVDSPTLGHKHTGERFRVNSPPLPSRSSRLAHTPSQTYWGEIPSEQSSPPQPQQ